VQVREPAPEKKGQGLEGWPKQRWTGGGGALTERGVAAARRQRGGMSVVQPTVAARAQQR
jgi:hypothetical protein